MFASMPGSASIPARGSTALTPSRVGSGELGFEVADARGHDVHELIDFLARDAEGRREPHHLAARVDDRAPIPRLPVELGDLLLVERPARPVGLHELRAHQKPAPAYLADDPLLAHRLLEPLAEPRAHRLGVRDEIVLLHNLD